MSTQNDAPHTVTFLNGAPEPDLVIPVAQPSGPPLLYANPAVFSPTPPSAELTRTGIYNSGVMNPVPGTTFTLKIGDMKPGLDPYICLLHDASGMEGALMVLAQPSPPQRPRPLWPCGGNWWERFLSGRRN
jgi:plastocyanin